MSPDFLAAESKKKCRAPFLDEGRVDVTRKGRVRSDSTNLRTCGRHKDAAHGDLTATCCVPLLSTSRSNTCYPRNT